MTLGVFGEAKDSWHGGIVNPLRPSNQLTCTESLSLQHRRWLAHQGSSPSSSMFMVLTIGGFSLQCCAPCQTVALNSSLPQHTVHSKEHIPNRNHLIIQPSWGRQLPAFPNQERQSLWTVLRFITGCCLPSRTLTYGLLVNGRRAVIGGSARSY
jgi:hypothetical protein